jgi:Xaa-Pro aminopeptidase
MNSPKPQNVRFLLLSQAITSSRLDGLLVTHLPGVRYLCGFTGSSGVLAVAGKQARLFTDGRYTQQAREEVAGAKVSIVKQAALTAAAEWLFKRADKIGFDDANLTVRQLQTLKKQLKACGARNSRLVAAEDIVARLRERKDSCEIEKIAAAVNLGSSLFPTALAAIRPGVAEVEVAGAIEYAARRAGAEGMSFDTIVASGHRSALPHGAASSSLISSRGFVVLDFGVILAGYCSDMTRTVSVGKASGAMRSMYKAVLEAQLAAIATVRAGVPAGQVDAAARGVLIKAKLGKYFTHSTGHGVGLEIHESPRIARGQQQPLEEGMVITIEPGVYIPGEGGVRIEDMVLVTATGCRVLTPTEKQLIEI